MPLALFLVGGLWCEQTSIWLEFHKHFFTFSKLLSAKYCTNSFDLKRMYPCFNQELMNYAKPVSCHNWSVQKKGEGLCDKIPKLFWQQIQFICDYLKVLVLYFKHLLNSDNTHHSNDIVRDYFHDCGQKKKKTCSVKNFCGLLYVVFKT